MLSKVLVLAAIAIGVSQPSVLHFEPLKEEPAKRVSALPDGHGAVVIFWRGDCAPCVEEMRHLADYRMAAGNTRILAMAVQPRKDAIDAAARLGLPSAGTYVVTDDPRQTLVAFGGAPARLPLSVHIDGSGHLLAVRHGLLGTDVVTAWTR